MVHAAKSLTYRIEPLTRNLLWVGHVVYSGLAKGSANWILKSPAPRCGSKREKGCVRHRQPMVPHVRVSSKLKGCPTRTRRHSAKVARPLGHALQQLSITTMIFVLWGGRLRAQKIVEPLRTTKAHAIRLRT